MNMTDVEVMGLFDFKVALVLHIVGALCLFGAITAAVLCNLWLRRSSTVEQVALTARTLRRLPLFFELSGGTILVSGLYLAYLDWSHGEGDLGWIIVTLVAFVGTAVIGAAHGRYVSHQLALRLAAHASLPSLRALASRSSFAWLTVNACIVVGILVVMVFQPDTLTAALTIVAAIVVGVELRPSTKPSLSD